LSRSVIAGGIFIALSVARCSLKGEWLLRQLTPGVAGDWISDFIDNGGVSLPLGDRAQEPREANHEADESRPEWNP
jgi:hypothetical protein